MDDSDIDIGRLTDDQLKRVYVDVRSELSSRGIVERADHEPKPHRTRESAVAAEALPGTIAESRRDREHADADIAPTQDEGDLLVVMMFGDSLSARRVPKAVVHAYRQALDAIVSDPRVKSFDPSVLLGPGVGAETGVETGPRHPHYRGR